MKPIWLGVIFLLVYGLFSMKTQAAEQVHATGADHFVRLAGSASGPL